MNYILKDKVPAECPDITEWVKWFETADRTVRKTTVGDVEVSTVFLGINHNFSRLAGQPILFETMIFGGEYDQHQERYCTWKEAERGHDRMVSMVSPLGYIAALVKECSM